MNNDTRKKEEKRKREKLKIGIANHGVYIDKNL
jgi:hypothetical protein